MSSDKYVGMDVHLATVVLAVLDARGKCVCQSVIETKGDTILEFIAGLRGAVHVVFEEGTRVGLALRSVGAASGRGRGL
jgi:hypothetical protein